MTARVRAIRRLGEKHRNMACFFWREPRTFVLCAHAQRDLRILTVNDADADLIDALDFFRASTFFAAGHAVYEPHFNLRIFDTLLTFCAVASNAAGVLVVSVITIFASSAFVDWDGAAAVGVAPRIAAADALHVVPKLVARRGERLSFKPFQFGAGRFNFLP